MSKFVNVDDLRELSIADFLARLGHHPVRKSGKELFYHSMLRETKRATPSLTVWDEGGMWLDRGGPNATGIHGGGIVQLGLAYWPQLSFVEVLNKIKETCDMHVSMIPAYNPVQYPKESETKGYTFELVRAQPIGKNFVLTKYLESRGILDVADGHLNEIYYRNRHQTDNGHNLRLETALTVPACLQLKTAAAHAPDRLLALAVAPVGYTGGFFLIQMVLKLAIEHRLQ